MNADTLHRLHEVTAKLDDRLTEAEIVRARFTKAQQADAWPDMRLAAQLLADANRAR